jgi:hypothetical protein
MEKKVLTQEEIQKLVSFRSSRIAVLEQLGSYEITLIELEEQKSKTKQEFLKLLKEEEEFSILLQQRYGSGTIDIEKGEFTSST